MFETENTLALIQLLAPLILLQVGLALYCIILIWRKGVQNLNKPVWTGIVLFFNLIGPVLYLMLGRKKYADDHD